MITQEKFFEIKRIYPFHSAVECKYCGSKVTQTDVWRVQKNEEVTYSCVKCNPTLISLEKRVNWISESCVSCGAYVPEGRMVCPLCEADPFYSLKK